MTRGRRRDERRLEQDLVIHAVLSQSDRNPVEVQAPAGFKRSARAGRLSITDSVLGPIPVPRFKSVSQAARWLEKFWASEGINVSVDGIRARYYLLKKVEGANTPKYVKSRL